MIIICTIDFNDKLIKDVAIIIYLAIRLCLKQSVFIKNKLYYIYIALSFVA